VAEPLATAASDILRLGNPTYERIDAPATREQKAALGGPSPDQVSAAELAGEPIRERMTSGRGNGAPCPTEAFN
jgi:phosphoglucomutase